MTVPVTEVKALRERELAAKAYTTPPSCAFRSWKHYENLRAPQRLDR